MNEKRNCKKHGYTLFKYKKSKNRGWFSCEECLKSQWRKASAKRRKNPEIKKYNQDYSILNYKIRKSLSVYLVMILLAANMMPE